MDISADCSTVHADLITAQPLHPSPTRRAVTKDGFTLMLDLPWGWLGLSLTANTTLQFSFTLLEDLGRRCGE